MRIPIMQGGVFRIILHSDMLFRLAQGWRYANDLGRTHGHWSSLMWWCCGDCGGDFVP